MYMPSGKYSLINVTLDMPDKGVYTSLDADIPALTKVYSTTGQNYGDYSRYVETKPASTEFVDISKAPYSLVSGTTDDVSEVLQSAIDSLKATGGIVYIPSGIYYIEKPITVYAGIELRGSFDGPHYAGITAAQFNTDYGRDDPDGTRCSPFTTARECAA